MAPEGTNGGDSVGQYFAYGSNMDEDQMAQRGLAFSSAEAAVLEGYRLGFTHASATRWLGGAADIIREEGAVVEGVLYSLEGDVAIMDPWEGVPDVYRRIQVEVRVARTGEPVGAWTYEVVDKLEYQVPSAGYIGKMILGARKHGISEGYVRSLELHLAMALGHMGDRAAVLALLAMADGPLSVAALSKATGLDVSGTRAVLDDLAAWGWAQEASESQGWRVPEDRMDDARRMALSR